MSQDLCRCGGVNALVYVLVILFGISSWMDINGLWVELPILVQNLPEAWDLPSYMAIIIQVANIAPLLYTLASWAWPRQRFETACIYIIISLGATACLLLALLWDVTSEVAGTEHSTALLALQFFLALVDCTSSVAFLPFMYAFKPQYMTAYFIGEGFSGMIPSLVALGQGAGSMKCVSFPAAAPPWSVPNLNDSNLEFNTTGGSLGLSAAYPTLLNTTQPPMFNVYPQFQEPRFSVCTFFLVLMTLMIVSLISFSLLKNWRYCKKEHSTKQADLEEDYSESFIFENNLKPINNGNDENYCGMDSAAIHLSGKTVEEMMNSLETQRVKSKDFATCNYQILEPKKTNQMQEFGSRSLSSTGFESTNSSTSSCAKEEKKTRRNGIPQGTFILFLLLTAWLNAVSNGILPSIQTYSCLPYGIKPYHLSVTLAAIANPIACFAASFICVTSVCATLVMTTVGSALAGYIVYTAVASPTPPLVELAAGTTLLILCWVLVVFFLTYTKVCIATVFRREGQGPRALLWVGAFTQVGSLAGALAAFLLVNVYKVFIQGNPCV